MNSRNKPCSCGSGIKYKRCCGDNAKKAKQNQLAWASLKPNISEELNSSFKDETATRRGLKKIGVSPNRLGMSMVATLAIATAMIGRVR